MNTVERMHPGREGAGPPDVASSTDEYAKRFSGPVGEYLLGTQRQALLALADPWRGGTVLDVGGGHAQLAGPLLELGFAVTVLGSRASCFDRPRRYFGDRIAYAQGDLSAPPFPDRAFDVVVSVRMLSHVDDPARFVAGVCRVARHAVIVDYADVRSANALVPLLFGIKRKVEGDTRSYRTYSRGELTALFAKHGFGRPKAIAEFFWPMVVHRALGKPAVSKALERVPRALGVTRRFGSPIVLRLERA